MRTVRSAGVVVFLLLVCTAGAEAQSSLTRPYSVFIVSPSAPRVAAGNAEQFSAVGMGDEPVHWSATGGTITPTGLYLAGATPGTYYVTARSRQRSSTVAVLVTARTADTVPSPRPVEVRPGESIQDAVAAHPAGTTFLIRRGRHVRQYVRPKNGMSFVGEAGAVLDGEGAVGNAFDLYRTSGVTIRGLRITNYAPPALNAAVEAGNSEGALIEGNEIDHNRNGALRAYGLRIGNGSVIRRNSIHHNGWLGIVGYRATDTLIEGNDIYANPPEWFNDTIGEAANVKLFECGRITIRGNYVHDSLFRGIWVDTMNPDVTIEHNRVVNHGRAGIWYEVSGRGLIQGNYVENAGYYQSQLSDWLRGGGIEITNSSDVTVVRNTVVNSLNGIIGLQAASYAGYRDGTSQLRNLLVEGNTIVMPRGQSGITENTGNTDVFSAWNNRFVGNRYELHRNPAPFAWMGRDVDEHEWQRYGQGTSDTYRR